MAAKGSKKVEAAKGVGKDSKPATNKKEVAKVPQEESVNSDKALANEKGFKYSGDFCKEVEDGFEKGIFGLYDADNKTCQDCELEFPEAFEACSWNTLKMKDNSSKKGGGTVKKEEAKPPKKEEPPVKADKKPATKKEEPVKAEKKPAAKKEEAAKEKSVKAEVPKAEPAKNVPKKKEGVEYSPLGCRKGSAAYELDMILLRPEGASMEELKSIRKGGLTGHLKGVTNKGFHLKKKDGRYYASI